MQQTMNGTQRTIHRYFVEGVEGSICHDAPDDIWYVIWGFAIVSVGLFVVAVSFRLLLQQKEVCQCVVCCVCFVSRRERGRPVPCRKGGKEGCSGA